jgi:DNA-nicking Smr family endonuclease
MTEEDRKLFRNAIGDVTPIKHQKVDFPPSKLKAKRLVQPKELFLPEADLEFPEVEIMSDDVLFFSRPGLQHNVIRRFKRGDYPHESIIDLHGHTVKEASIALQIFLDKAQHNQHRCICIIHGKGRDPGKKATLKTYVNHWLKKNNDILAFCSATRENGHTGAMYALLRQKK